MVVTAECAVTVPAGIIVTGDYFYSPSTLSWQRVVRRERRNGRVILWDDSHTASQHVFSADALVRVSVPGAEPIS